MNFDEALTKFVAGVQARIDAEFSSKTVLKIDPKGKQYIRLYTETDGRQMCWGFIVKEDVNTKQFNFKKGDVAKSAGWKTPAKHARGNIFAEDNGLSCVTAYGPNYLK